MVATQNIDTLGPIWTFSLRGVLTFVRYCICLLCDVDHFALKQEVEAHCEE